ncbi:type II toxin-antitoxin system YoeB family toxin [Winslowiella arboricola]|uniref:type II toxin-antitoxin system YoeB family toxin n=1 Tax=Winslowiella arboricola TaxID=2978220 RepID=UPI002B202131|nr:type II toxin-antitoxin system YoeB family toxin [Winslowiella arboricola]
MSHSIIFFKKGICKSNKPSRNDAYATSEVRYKIPAGGIGKPERLSHLKKQALYSRRTDREHRLVYNRKREVNDNRPPV